MSHEEISQNEERKEQKVLMTDNERDVLERVAKEMGMEVRFEPSGEFEGPAYNATFNASDEDVEKAINKVEEELYK